MAEPYLLRGAGPLGQRQEQSDYLVANLMAHYDITPQISAQLNVNNLLDQEHRTGVNWYGQGIWGAPRSLLATLNYSFEQQSATRADSFPQPS
ncbi:TonB-dependent receptor [Pseudomonas aeruginosa]|nr:TonB-dependent receptor [Pseudomonas aeruginosa]MCO2419164.1 TonB-dependent receptor [Pseudomonas aeruginosa]MDQ4176603.1 TonB-dependent receptor [Pseudomonas aeruginosa]MDQ4184224.1 TonB-dependent receptor [Pseudomonas aeruginosa]MDQ4186881.1 TonB-dependent receptor [Pseudomonas aeruginosa]MDQ4209018.1 TonB-dependent receptor [Pseudomonas aeruginosa]